MSAFAVNESAPAVVLAGKQLLSGDEAVAFAALDAGIRFASAYPGTPTTNIQETLQWYSNPAHTKVVWSINEKVAYESALAVAIAGRRALVSMKQVGLNVAADAFINSCPAGVNGGLVLVVGDDAECHSSPHKQDTRLYRPIAGTLLLEPADSQEAYAMTRLAFELSERFLLPIMIRLSTRVAYGSTPVMRQPQDDVQEGFDWPKQPERFFTIPTLSRRLFLRLAEIQDVLANAVNTSLFTKYIPAAVDTDRRQGVLCTGIGFQFSSEYAPSSCALLKVAGEPFPDEQLKTFLQDHDEVFVLEEGDPILEARARAQAPPETVVRGRLSNDLRIVGELQPADIIAMFNGRRRLPKQSEVKLPARMPEICKPCGYNKVYAALKEIADIATPSDIGCNTLGGLPPYEVMDGVWAMGSSIGVACGLAAIGHRRVLAIIGDSTFFHAGIPPLIEAVHEGLTLTVLLLDNGTTAMTGGQSVPHRSTNLIQNSIDLVALIEALGVQRCTPFDPHKLGKEGIRDLIESSFTQPGVKVLLYRSQCGIYTPGYFTDAPFALPRREADE